MTIGERIKAARKSAGMSQKDLAAKMGVTQSNISQYENDYATPSMATLFKYADALGCGVSDLYFDKEAAFAEIERYSRHMKPEMKEERIRRQMAYYDSFDRVHLVPDEEEKLVSYYNHLNAAGKEKLLSYASDLAQISTYTTPDSE